MKNELTYSTYESNRFNMNVFRGNIDKISIGQLHKTIIKNNVDVLIFRIESEKVEQLAKLNSLGIPFIQADTLVYYYLNLLDYQPKAFRNNDLEFVVATPKNTALLNDMVRTIFVGYTNHYNSNPYLDKQNITEGYQEWVASYLTPEDDSKICYLVKKNGQYAGFATVGIDKENEEGEGILYGVMPEFSGMGIYSDIIRYTQLALKEQGIPTMKVSTQIQNYAVQKVWGREGFYLKQAYTTVHINALLSVTQKAVDSFELEVTEADIKEFTQLSKDYNPLHLDDAFAQSCGFNNKIAHGLLGNAIMSKYYGTEYPGAGTIFLGYRYTFMAPIYPNHKYTVEVSFPSINPEKGLYESVAKIKDTSGKICLLAYSYLKK